ncbi:N-acetylglucosamine-6-phosphate deacetylase [Thermoflavifilum thermophilum]|uniref:N-acetylglucosamine-6-phosphate deacetylase n=1 Tax=Thermoflavifilum thermophilum TaxID=1393122 RepID=A0A1I7N997_9BACT|nr:N-acetylglucosamine-6-phosphate deacetylase [Thermoflavifilum thermophilum]SFV31250.1 N-acetylglucosamine-6-phosphate deacetylase [Thermoflavifilum thermophilum]
MRQAYYNGFIYTGKEILKHLAVLMDGYEVLDIVPESAIPEGFQRIDVQGNHIAPGLIDLQIYGGNGQLFSLYPDVSTILATEQYCKAGGALYFQPTIATNEPGLMQKALEAYRQYRDRGGKAAIGVHWEGPFINPQKRGAHVEKYIRPLQKDEAKQLTEHQDALRTLTLAPECCDAACVEILLQAGIRVSAGHSAASYEQARQAFTKTGIRLTTHLFNAMSPLQTRDPGLVGAIFEDPAVYASIIADGIHVHPANIRISKAIMGNRLFLITDAVEESKNEPYIYLRQKDRYVNQEGVLAGSTLTMLKAVAYCVQQVGIALDEALRMASWYPAKAMGMDQQAGLLQPGYHSGLIVFDDNFELLYRSV